MCNPPFHDSEESAIKGNLRKTKNLNKSKSPKTNLNFSGQQSELWCDGGELAFISRMIEESVLYSSQILWFTCLVSKKENLFKLTSLLKNAKAIEVRTIDMAQGQKISRILAWTFISQIKEVIFNFFYLGSFIRLPLPIFCSSFLLTKGFRSSRAAVL